jgi:hypothetical protein
MMNAPSTDVKSLLSANQTLGFTFANNLFVSEMPSAPDACVAIFDTGGFDDVGGLDTGSGFVYERPTVQVRVRGAKGAFVNADALARKIKDALHGQHGVDVGGTRYISILAQGNVAFIGYDESRRPLIVANFRMDRTVAPPTPPPPPPADPVPYMMPAGRRGDDDEDDGLVGTSPYMMPRGRRGEGGDEE